MSAQWFFLFSSLIAIAAAQACLFNTGVDSGGSALAGGSSDSHWIVNGGAAFAVNNPTSYAWRANFPGAAWISPTASGTSVPAGTSTYSIQFNLGIVAYTLGYVLTLDVYSDDGATVKMNGVQQGTPTGPGNTWTVVNSFTINTDFVVGMNTLSIDVSNAGTGPSGLLVRFTSACAVADPVFVDLDGKRFVYAGEANRAFHIFSDPFVSVNALFGVANPATGKGTVLTAFGVRWANHSLTFGVDSPTPDHSLLVALDDAAVVLPQAISVPLAGSPCMKVSWSFPELRLQTPSHTFDFEIVMGVHNAHINRTYVNIDFSLPEAQANGCGGIICQTGFGIDTKVATYLTTDLESMDSKTSKYAARTLCKA